MLIMSLDIMVYISYNKVIACAEDNRTGCIVPNAQLEPFSRIQRFPHERFVYDASPHFTTMLQIQVKIVLLHSQRYSICSECAGVCEMVVLLYS